MKANRGLSPYQVYNILQRFILNLTVSLERSGAIYVTRHLSY